jgi:ankyrin repeat protein
MTRAIFKNFLPLIFVGVLSCVQNSPEVDQIKFALAAVNGDIFTVKKLVERGGIDLDAKNGKIGPALTSAAYGGHGELVKLLLEKGANINVRDENGLTPLMNAAIAGQAEVVRILLERNADPNVAIADKDGNLTITALSFAKVRRHTEIIGLLENSKKTAHGEFVP